MDVSDRNVRDRDSQATEQLWVLLSAIGAAEGEQERVELLTTGLPSLVDCSVSGVALRGEDGSWRLRIYKHGQAVPVSEAAPLVTALDSLASRAAGGGFLVFEPDHSPVTDRSALCDWLGIRVLGVVPARTVDHDYGVLLVGRTRPDAFVRRDEAILRVFAGQLALTLEKRQLERALRRSEQQYRNIYNRTPVMMHSINHQGEIVSVNSHWLQVMGYDREQVLGQRSVDFLTPASRQRAISVDIPHLHRAGAVSDRQYQFVTKEGRTIDVLLSATCQPDEQGRIGESFAYIVDVTERKRMEEALKRSHDELEDLVGERTAKLESVNKALRDQIDKKERIQKDLRAHAERLRTLQSIDRSILEARSPSEIADAALEHMWNLLPCRRVSVVLFESEVGVVTALRDAPETRIPLGARVPLELFGHLDELGKKTVRQIDDTGATGEGSLIREDGLRSVINVPLRSQGQLIGTLNVGAEQPHALSADQVAVAVEVANSLSVALEQARLNDEVTLHAQQLEKRVAERTAELEAANKQLQSFSYSVSHDLRAPLRSIDGFSRILMEEHAQELDAEPRRLLATVRAKANKMGQLIDDLLEFSRSARAEMTMAEVDVGQLAKSVFEELLPPDRTIAFSVGDLPAVRGDRAMIRQALVNLLSNAIKFTAPMESARIEVGQVPGKPDSFFIKDNGVGFDSRYSDRMFGVFQRLHSEFEGTGVGLAIVQQIVEKHGGRVWAEGQPDRGATVFLTLPRAGSR